MCIISTMKIIKHQLKKLKIHREKEEKKTPPLKERYPIFMGQKRIVQMTTPAKAICRVYTIPPQILTESISSQKQKTKPENAYIIHKVSTKAEATVSKKNIPGSIMHSKKNTPKSA